MLNASCLTCRPPRRIDIRPVVIERPGHLVPASPSCTPALCNALPAHPFPPQGHELATAAATQSLGPCPLLRGGRATRAPHGPPPCGVRRVRRRGGAPPGRAAARCPAAARTPPALLHRRCHAALRRTGRRLGRPCLEAPSGSGAGALQRGSAAAGAPRHAAAVRRLHGLRAPGDREGAVVAGGGRVPGAGGRGVLRVPVRVHRQRPAQWCGLRRRVFDRPLPPGLPRRDGREGAEGEQRRGDAGRPSQSVPPPAAARHRA